jgi:hypothetical protein
MSTATASKTYRKQNKRPNPVKNPGTPNRKQAARLDARMKDYAAMVNRAGFQAPEGAFHRPGSFQ